MIDDRAGIIARRLQKTMLPRAVDGRGRQFRELRYPLTHIGALRIEALALQHGIEDAEIGCGIGPRAGYPAGERPRANES